MVLPLQENNADARAIKLYTVVLHACANTYREIKAVCTWRTLTPTTHMHKYAERRNENTPVKPESKTKKVCRMKGVTLGEYLDQNQMNTLVKDGVNLWKWWS